MSAVPNEPDTPLSWLRLLISNYISQVKEYKKKEPYIITVSNIICNTLYSCVEMHKVVREKIDPCNE